MAKKLDMSRVKDFLFNHGEKVALGTCAVLGIILGLWGVMAASGAGRHPGGSDSWADYFRKKAASINAGMNQPASTEAVTAPAAIDPQKSWPFLKSTHVPSPLIAIADVNNDKRQRPKVLPIVVEREHMKYVSALVYQYDYGTGRNNERVLKGLEMPGAAAGVGGGAIPMPPVMMPKGGPKGGKGFPPPMPGGGGVAGPSLPFAKKGEPQRMVVVHGRFPMKQQMMEFQKALRMIQQDEMLQKNREDLPRPLGLDIIRVEVLPDDKVKSDVLVGYVSVTDNKIKETKQFTINKKLEDLLRKSMFDERSSELMREHIWAGLTMPMPRLANHPYPKFEMKGFDFDWAVLDDDNPIQMAGGAPPMPMPKAEQPPRKDPKGIELPGMGKGREKKANPPEGGGGGATEPREPAPEYLLKDIPEKELRDSNPGLIARIFGGKDKRVTDDLNVFHVLGRYPTEEAAANPNPAMPGHFNGGMGGANQDQFFTAWDLTKGELGKEGGPMPPAVSPRPTFGKPGGPAKPMNPGGFMGGMGAGERFPDWDRDGIVRFIDPDVKPGKKYKYWVRVRMANPNHKKLAKEVAFQDLTLHAELPPSEWIETPEIDIPHEYYLYAIDQQLHDDWETVAAPKKGVTPALKLNEVLNATPFQIHQWVESKRDPDSASDLMIGDWVVGERKLVFKGEPIGSKVIVQAPVWFEKKDIFDVPMPPTKNTGKKEPKGAAAIKGIQVDMFPEGGKPPVLVDFAGGKRLTPANTLLEETAVDALVLMPDGRLKVLNSRSAADATAAAGGKTEAKERIDRLINFRKRIDEVLHSAPTGVGDPAMPGMPGMPKGPRPGGPPPKGKV